MEKHDLNHIFKKRLHKNHTLPQKQQYEHIVKQETIDPEYKYKRTTKNLVKIEIGLCPECDNTTYCLDYHRGERVCPKCGYVFSNTVFEKPRYAPINKIKKVAFSEKEKMYLKNKNFHYFTEAQEWKQRQLEREIDVICSSLKLNSKTKSLINEIILRAKNLKKLHSKAKVTTILLGVARYCMKNQEHKDLVNLRYDRGLFNENLCRNDYEIIQKNIHKLFGEDYAYKKKAGKKKKKRKPSKKYNKNNKRRTKKGR